MRRRLQLTLGLGLVAMVLLGAAPLRSERFIVAAGKEPARRPKGPCFADGEALIPSKPVKAPAEVSVTKSGCLRVRMRKTAHGERIETWSFRTPDGGGPPRGTMTLVSEEHASWEVEATDGDRDGHLEFVSVIEFSDAGEFVRRASLTRDRDGGYLELIDKTIADAKDYLVQKSEWRDGGWVEVDSFKSARQHGVHHGIQELKPH